MDDVDRTLRNQAGVISFRQWIDGGRARHLLAKALRRRELRQVHPRVYVDHTGPLTYRQRAWAATLYAGGMLCLHSVSEETAGLGPIHVAIDRSRRVQPLADVVVHRVAQLAGKGLKGAQPPRLRAADNTIMLAGLAESDTDVVRILTDAGRPPLRTSPAQLRAALARFPTVRRRQLIAALIEDVDSGVCSVLEHGYLTRVERAHHLPTPERQARRTSAGGVQYRDMAYAEWGIDIELDGRLNHDSWAAGNRDAARDLDDVAAGRLALRLRWQQVMVDSCRTAGQVAAVLRSRGWTGTPEPCGPGCPVLTVMECGG